MWTRGDDVRTITATRGLEEQILILQQCVGTDLHFRHILVHTSLFLGAYLPKFITAFTVMC